MRRHAQHAAMVIFSLLAIVALALPSTAGDEVRIDSGTISGAPASAGSKVRAYKGIPYAAPPVGKLRWQPPQPVTAWQGVRKCDQFGPICPQAPYPATSIYAQAPQPQSEDCLLLNVWTAAEGADEKRPVMVWIHGGALTRGSGSIPAYDGEQLAIQGVVLVTINYRLGPLGFLAHPALSRESEHGSSGNYGVLDQIAALRWVQRNIAAFGGDPSRVTIFGESAGSWSVCALVATPLAKGLFHRAIGQSGGCFEPMADLKRSRYGLPPAEQGGQQLAVALGCDQSSDPLAAMREKSAEEIVALANKDGSQVRARANVDGWAFPAEIREIYAAGKQSQVPVIVGSNADEGNSLVGHLAPNRMDAFVEGVRKKYGALADQFLQVYPVTSDSDARGAFLHAAGDEMFTWEMRTWARMSEKSGQPAYLYYFSHVPPRPDAEKLGAYHAAEILYVFDNLNIAPWPQQASDKALAHAMSAAWVRFAATGDPNGDGLPSWTPYDSRSESYLEFGDSIRPGKSLRKAECDFVEAYMATRSATGVTGTP